MQQRIKILLRDLWYFFPIQLLLSSFKRQQFLLLPWGIFSLLIFARFGINLGVPYLFLDPEYLGKVGYLSFSLVGMGLGILYVFWNLISYMLNAHRFPFMASLRYPMLMFFLNNSILPILFVGGYVYAIIHFQVYEQFESLTNTALLLMGLAAGFTMSILLFSIYFQFTNTSAAHVLMREKALKNKKKFRVIRKANVDEEISTGHVIRVDYYLTNTFRIRHTRKDPQHRHEVGRLVFRQHHLNAFFMQLFTVGILMVIGFFVENPLFQIPTAASVFLFGSILISLLGSFMFYSSGWGTVVIFLAILGANQLTKLEILGYRNGVTGLNYKTAPASYNNETLSRLCSDSLMEADKKYFLPILENWKKKNVAGKNKNYKPRLVFINVSGGGLRSATFVTNVLQRADSLLNGKLFEKTVMISGASGGMFGASYLREIYLQKMNGRNISLQDSTVRNNIAKDLLNPMIITFLSNDLLIPFHKKRVNGHEYFRDRGFMFEKQLASNLGSMPDHPLVYYKKAEYEARIPLMIYHTTIINDSRRFFISPQPVSFLSRPLAPLDSSNLFDIDAIDYGRFFFRQGANQTRMGSVNRMNATFPYIFPNPVLPSDPPVYLMDAGVVDNFGSETTQRFIYTFKDWIKENTSGITVIQVRDNKKMEEPEIRDKRTFLAEVLDPLGVMYNNLENLQDYRFDYAWNYLENILNSKIEIIHFEYEPEVKDKKASMSLHLTEKEKKELNLSMYRLNNSAKFNQLVKSLYD